MRISKTIQEAKAVVNMLIKKFIFARIEAKTSIVQVTLYISLGNLPSVIITTTIIISVHHQETYCQLYIPLFCLFPCTDGRYFYHISGTALFSCTNVKF